MSLLAQDERLTRRVGTVTLVLLAASIGFFVLIYDQIEWGSHTRLEVYFHTTGGLREGATFVVAGKAVGKVESIALVPRGTTTILGDADGVVVKVAIESKWARRIQYGGDVFITSRGVLSGKYLEIGPAPEPGRSLREGDEILGRDPPSLDRVLQRTWDNMTAAAQFAAAVRPEWRAFMDEVDKLRATLELIAPDVALAGDIAALRDEAGRMYDALGGDTGVDRMRAMLDRGDATFAQARATIAKLEISLDKLGAALGNLRGKVGARGAEAIDRIEAAIDQFRAAIAKVDPLLAQVEALREHFVRGDGSVLKLMRDPEFPEDAKELGKILKRQPWKIISRPPK
jgi:ABC-type transporter Mla subunit MlaD